MTNDELPEGWAATPVSAVCLSTADGDHQAPPQVDSGVPFITISAIADGKLRLDKATRQVSQKYYEQLKDERRARQGDILFSVTGSIGKVAYVDHGDRFVFQRHIAVLRPDKTKTDGHYLQYALQTPNVQKQAHSVATGTAQLTIPLGGLRELILPIAPLAEQKRIADKLEAVLGRVDACRARLDRVPDLLKRFRQSVLAAATSGQLTQTGQEDDSATWLKVPFEDLLADKNKLSYGVLKPGDHDTDGVPMYRVVDIGEWGRANKTEPSYISKELSREFSRTIVEEGDILLSVMATIGRAMVASKEMAGANVNRALAVIKPDRTKVNSHFLMYYFLSPALVTEFEERSIGSAQVRINLGDLRQFIINLPPLAEQAEIVRRVESLFALADRIEARLATAQRLVERLTPATLSKAFRGDLVPQDPNDEPASKLLERLRTAGAEPKAQRKKSS
jgi:type I restriction enzyme S subunit